MRLKLISCDIFEYDLRAAAARSRNEIDIEFLPTPLHRLRGPALREALQEMVDRHGRMEYHALLLVAGSCKAGLTGLEATSIPLVLPRARDCISLVLDGTGPTPRFTESHTSPPLSRRRRPSVGQRQPHQSEATYWMVPVHDPKEAVSTARGALRQAHPRLALAPLPTLRPERRSHGSLLERLVDGYWDYQQFVVIAPGSRLLVDEQTGNLRTEENV